MNAVVRAIDEGGSDTTVRRPSLRSFPRHRASASSGFDQGSYRGVVERTDTFVLKRTPPLRALTTSR